MAKDRVPADELLKPLLEGDERELGLTPPPTDAGAGAEHGGHGAAHTSVRTAEHRGHQLRVETTYRVLIDGDELAEAFHVLDNGKVTYHGLPAYAMPSAIDMLKLVVDRLEVTQGRDVEDELNPAEPEEGNHGHA